MDIYARLWSVEHPKVWAPKIWKSIVMETVNLISSRSFSGKHFLKIWLKSLHGFGLWNTRKLCACRCRPDGAAYDYNPSFRSWPGLKIAQLNSLQHCKTILIFGGELSWLIWLISPNKLAVNTHCLNRAHRKHHQFKPILVAANRSWRYDSPN